MIMIKKNTILWSCSDWIGVITVSNTVTTLRLFRYRSEKAFVY